MSKIKIPKYNLAEELISSISHGIGAGLSIWCLVLLILKASKIGSLEVVTVTLFGTTMVLLYTMSCIYHALSRNVCAKKVFRILDHCNVFLLVFGTIIPVSLVGIQGMLGWIFFVVVAIVTIVGIALSAINVDKYQVMEVICHLINGWSVVFFAKPLISNIGTTGFLFIILGGVMYSLGSILYGVGSRKKYVHSIFHFFCLAGTLFHFLSIYLYIL
ncbi:MAG: hemolysin III family protein [Bacilli bacterium]|nr:hemolysin III family protein [Bacilli bacterium]